MSAFLELENVSCAYGARSVLEGVSLCVNAGETFGLLGPNGAGKTSLIRIVSRTHPAAGGEVCIGGRPMAGHSMNELARLIAVVPQSTNLDFPFTAQEMVALGRRPFMPRFRFENAVDLGAIENAMRLTGVWELRDRLFYELSGGEAQRVVIARCLAQECRLLLLDEPTSHLDIRYQSEIFSLLRRLAREKGLAVLISTHDLNAAAQFCDRAALLKDGRLYAIGNPADIITRESVSAVYETDVRVSFDAEKKIPIVLMDRPPER